MVDLDKTGKVTIQRGNIVAANRRVSRRPAPGAPSPRVRVLRMRKAPEPRDWEEAEFVPSPGLETSELERLPLFPLPGAVLFPGTFMPLHIFEPRYRALVKSALEQRGAMGVVQLRRDPPGGDVPRVHQVTGVGRIAQCQELPDGRYLILLAGLARARIVRECTTDEPFRRFELVLLDETVVPAASAARELETLRSCLRPVAADLTEGGAPLLQAAEHATDPGEFADLLTSVLIDDSSKRQRLLEMTDAQRRVNEVVHYLAEVLLEKRKKSGSSALN